MVTHVHGAHVGPASDGYPEAWWLPGANNIPPGYGSPVSDEAGVIRQHCLPPGEVTITIEKDGYHAAQEKLKLIPGKANRIEIRLKKDLK